MKSRPVLVSVLPLAFLLTVLVPLALLVLSPAVASAVPGPITFASPVSYGSAGVAPDFSATGYFDADAYPDIAVPFRASNTVRVLLGDGSGGFSWGSTLAVGDQPHAVQAADLNEDGFTDLVLGYYSQEVVAILIADGAGSFSMEQTLAAGPSHALDIADLDGDGDLDIAVPNRTRETVSVLAGDGSGSFSQVATVTVGGGVDLVGTSTGDFDGDGDNDIAAASISTGSISILLSDGAGGFSVGTTLAVGSNPRAPAICDFDFDGDLDLAVSNFASDTLSLRPGNGDGTFSAGTTLTVAHYPEAPVVDDLDGDGLQDLLVGGVSNISVLRGDGNGGFSYETTLASPSSGTLPVTCDFDGDQRPDLALGRLAADDVYVWRNTTLFDSSLALTALGNPVRYGGRTWLEGTLMSDWRLIDYRNDVQIWRKSAFDRVWLRDGTARYDEFEGAYYGLRSLGANTRFKMVFLGGSVWKPAVSNEVLVKAYASLSTPSLSTSSPRRYVYFTCTGTLRPRHATPGSTKLYFYRKVLGRWRYYTARTATLTNHSGYTGYACTYRLPYTGSWYVRAYHSDASHAATWSGIRYFTVR
ncbi:MAG: VCBS repeat-containing protein [Actinobacteria bacterium]|nr:MAG: VCBS repeat-containing protein [Actinomycetota bacterium]